MIKANFICIQLKGISKINFSIIFPNFDHKALGKKFIA